jgi:hypothetical protein
MEHVQGTEIMVAAAAGSAAGMATSAATGAATEFGKRLAGAGADWLAERFGRHADRALATAKDSGDEFIRSLDARIKLLEDSSELDRGVAETAFERPDTLAVLRTAYYGASESGDAVKRAILTALVADRLKSGVESVEAATSRLAIERAVHVTSRQLRTLAQLSAVHGVRPDGLAESDPTEHTQRVGQWLISKLDQLAPVEFHHMDLMHLHSLVLVEYDNKWMADLKAALSAPLSGRYFDISVLGESQRGAELLRAWNTGWKHVQQTFSGSYLGVYSLDALTGERTTIRGID